MKRWGVGAGRGAAAVGAACVVATLGGGVAPASARPSRAVPIARDGAIGSLTLNRSTTRDVIRAWGSPDQRRVGNVGAGPSYPEFTLLGYECHGPRSTFSCAINFYISHRTWRLESFTTTSPRFRLFGGVTVGMSGTLASRREHRPEFIGCGSGIDVPTRTMDVDLGLVGAHLVGGGARALGGHVQNIAIDDRAHGVGVLFC